LIFFAKLGFAESGPFARGYCLSITFNRKRNVAALRVDHALVRSHCRRRIAMRVCAARPHCGERSWDNAVQQKHRTARLRKAPRDGSPCGVTPITGNGVTRLRTVRAARSNVPYYFSEMLCSLMTLP